MPAICEPEQDKCSADFCPLFSIVESLVKAINFPTTENYVAIKAAEREIQLLKKKGGQ